MKVSVSEALRLKNEIIKMVHTTLGDTRIAEYGVTTEDDKPVTERESCEKFPEVYAKLCKIFSISHQINSVLAKYDVESGISDLVRSLKNNEALLTVLTDALRLKDSTQITYQAIGNKRVEVKRHFTPYVPIKEIKCKITLLKKEIRDIKRDIDKKNLETIELPFEHTELDSF